MRRIASHYLIDRGAITPRPVVSVADDGQILSVEQWERLDSLASTEFYAGALTAGFVNAHCHLELSYLKGAIEPGTGFAGFARAIGQVRGGFTPDERQRAMATADARMWSEGVQAVADIVNGDTSFSLKSRSRIRYKNFAEFFGLNNDVANIAPLSRMPHTSATPHSTYSVQDKAMRQVVEMAEGEPLSIHFMESPDELQLFAGEGSLAAWYERMGWQCDFLHHGSPAQRLVAMLEREQRLILVHNCCVREEDITLITSHFTHPVAWVVCPQSNAFISSLRPAEALLQLNDVMICVGTDSLASNTNLSIIEELKLLNDVPLAESIGWATINGARALGMEREIGSVEVGKRPGIVLIEGIEDTNGLRLTPTATSRRLI